MKKLPKIYQNNSAKKIKNNKEICYLRNEKQNSYKEGENDLSTKEIINEIFSGIGYSYNIPVKIITDQKIYTTSLIAKTKEKVVTLDNEVIAIKDIKSIELI